MKKLSAIFALAAALTVGTGSAMAVTTTTQPADGSQLQQPETIVPEMKILPQPIIVNTPQGRVLTDRVPNIRTVQACTPDGSGAEVTFTLGFFVGLSQQDMARDGTTIEEFMNAHADEINAGIDAVWEEMVDKHGFDALTNGSPAFEQDLRAGLDAFFKTFEQDTGMTMGMQILRAQYRPGCADHGQTPAPRP